MTIDVTQLLAVADAVDEAGNGHTKVSDEVLIEHIVTGLISREITSASGAYKYLRADGRKVPCSRQRVFDLYEAIVKAAREAKAAALAAQAEQGETDESGEQAS